MRGFLGPQGLSILSGVLLAGYWFGGDGLLLFAGLSIPGAIALASLASGGFGSPLGRDALTGLANRQAAVRRLARLLEDCARTGRETACFVLQIDEFDDAIGRQDTNARDEILLRTAERLRAAMREEDVIARLDGETFAVVPRDMRRADLENGIQLASRLLAILAEPVAIGAAQFYVTASVGFALPRQLIEPSATELVEAAECAAAEARRQGRGTIRAFSPGERRPRVIPSRLTDGVSQALDDGQIQAWFQPQVSTDTGAVVGFEALARWHHPTYGMIAPAEFLPAVVAAGRAGRLHQVILTQALNALKGWDRDGFDVPAVAVNLGEDTLRDPRLPERMQWELERFALAPGRLCVEVLETVLVSGDNDLVARNIARLAEMGVSIDLDDFGTGTASIAAIRRFSVNRIKIDRSFVTRIDSDRGQQDMAAAILSMAERLNLATLAEGVESLGEHAMLAQLGCGAVQGYAIAPPMPFHETLGWMRRHQATVEAATGAGRKVV